MRVSKMISKENFNKAIKEGIYTILLSKDADIATKKSKEYNYFKVEYLSPSLHKSNFFVAVYN